MVLCYEFFTLKVTLVSPYFYKAIQWQIVNTEHEQNFILIYKFLPCSTVDVASKYVFITVRSCIETCLFYLLETNRRRNCKMVRTHSASLQLLIIMKIDQEKSVVTARF